jgi:hypothetical protein
MSFDDFWAIYPRKVAKKDARKAWASLGNGQMEAAIDALPLQARHWQALGTGVEFIPYPASWLRGERWEDELPEIKPKQDEWWRSGAGIIAKGKALGLDPRPGEELSTFAQRIRERA